jgi:hypothetical protein
MLSSNSAIWKRNMIRYQKNNLVFILDEDYEHKSSILDVEFKNDWISINPKGHIKVKKRYSWNGCSPKINFLDMIIGTPEGELNPETDKPKTYYASMIHDALYQFSEDLSDKISRRQADKEFHEMLKAEKFRPADLYYAAVRMFSGQFWA